MQYTHFSVLHGISQQKLEVSATRPWPGAIARDKVPDRENRRPEAPSDEKLSYASSFGVAESELDLRRKVAIINRHRRQREDHTRSGGDERLHRDCPHFSSFSPGLNAAVSSFCGKSRLMDVAARRDLKFTNRTFAGQQWQKSACCAALYKGGRLAGE